MKNENEIYISEENDMIESMICAPYEDTGKKCPRCGSTDTNKENGIWYCTRCDYEW